MKKILTAKIIAVVLALILTASISYAINWDFWEDSSEGVGPIETDWYAVEDWELEVCYKWGGPEHATTVSTGTASYVYTTTATIQALKDTIEYPNGTIDILYQAAWYVKPMTDSLDYRVELTNGAVLEVGSGTADANTGGSGYYAQYLSEDYTKATLYFGSDSLEVDIAEIED